jgi:hypothetical protein
MRRSHGVAAVRRLHGVEQGVALHPAELRIGIQLRLHAGSVRITRPFGNHGVVPATMESRKNAAAAAGQARGVRAASQRKAAAACGSAAVAPECP